MLFFAVYKWKGFFWATGVLMVASVVSLVLLWRREHRIPPMPLITAALVLVLGGLTILMQDETLLKLKVTAVNAAFGLVLLVGMLFKKQLIRMVLGEALHLTDRGWTLLTRLWAGWFFFLAALNEVVWRNTSTDTWVNFKMFGLLGLTFVFGIAQAPLIAKHEAPRPEPEPESEPGS